MSVPSLRASRRLLVIVVALGVAEGGCAGYKFQSHHGVRTSSTTRRVSPRVQVRLPDGVAPGVRAVVTYPPGTSRDEALKDFLVRANDRGAGWVSKLQAYTLAKENACAMDLLPQTVARDHDAMYLTEESYMGGATDYSVSTRRESVDVPFLRALDDLDSIVEDVDIWTSKQRRRCEFGPHDAIEIAGGIHGRVGIGVRKGANRIDLRECTPGAPSAGPSEDTGETTVILLGNIRAMDIAAEVLPGWVQSRVMLELPDKQVQGVLTRYHDGNMSVQADDGSWTYAHVMDAKGILLVERGEGYRASVPGAPPSESERSLSPDSPDCKRWRAEPEKTQTF